MFFTRNLLLGVLVLVTGARTISAAPEPPAQSAIDAFIRSIDLRETLSREQSAWDRQKRILESEKQLLIRQREEIAEQIAQLESRQTESMERRETLLSEKKREDEAKTALNDLLGLVEERFPPFLSSLPPWVPRFEQTQTAESSPSDPMRRLRAQLAFLRDTSDFNHRIRLGSTVLELPGDAPREVTTLSFGLAASYLVAPDGSDAWTYRYADGEWVLRRIPEFASAVQNAVAQQSGRIEPNLVLLPVELMEDR